MSLRCSACLLPLVLTLAACHSAPSLATAPSDGGRTIDRTEQQLRWLASRAALGRELEAPFGSAAESAGMTEIAARLATLTERLDELIARWPVNASDTAAIDATTTRLVAAADADLASIEVLQQALHVVERQRNACIENLANVDTPGFKKIRLAITTELHPASGMQVPAVASSRRIVTNGVLQVTDRNLDLAIDGEGFFAVTLPDLRVAYTRDGNLHLNAEGKLVTSSGHVLRPEIAVPDDALDVAIDLEGRVSVRTAVSPATSTLLGRIHLHRFVDPGDQLAVGSNLFVPTDEACPALSDAPDAQDVGLIRQGFLERANVEVLDELIHLQLADRQRALLRRVLASRGVFVR